MVQDDGSRSAGADPLARFVEAQASTYRTALAELANGRKRSHWMWFVFPQVEGLGRSAMAHRYAIRSRAEALAYLAHPVLGPRLRACAQALLTLSGNSAFEVLGTPDDLKLRSSMTLFDAVSTQDAESAAMPGTVPGTMPGAAPTEPTVFREVLERYFDGEPDAATLEVLDRWADAESASPWERPEVVARFAERLPDHRLQALMAGSGAYAEVRRAWAARQAPRLLDLGCGGGRNTVWLAKQGADVWALDASRAMVDETRRRLTRVLGVEEATLRVRHGGMRDLRAYEDAAFDLVVALGVMQDATDEEEWVATLAGTARVLATGGLCLVANFDPSSRPAGVPLTRVEGEPHGWRGFAPDGRRMTLLSPGELDAAFARHGLSPALPTEAVRVETERGFRVTVNALYRRDGPGTRPTRNT